MAIPPPYNSDTNVSDNTNMWYNIHNEYWLTLKACEKKLSGQLTRDNQSQSQASDPVNALTEICIGTHAYAASTHAQRIAWIMSLAKEQVLLLLWVQRIDTIDAYVSVCFAKSSIPASCNQLL